MNIPRGSVWFEKRAGRRLVGVVTTSKRTVRIQTVQLVFGVPVCGRRARVTCITTQDMRRRFRLHADLAVSML